MSTDDKLYLKVVGSHYTELGTALKDNQNFFRQREASGEKLTQKKEVGLGLSSSTRNSSGSKVKHLPTFSG